MYLVACNLQAIYFFHISNIEENLIILNLVNFTQSMFIIVTLKAAPVKIVIKHYIFMNCG